MLKKMMLVLFVMSGMIIVNSCGVAGKNLVGKWYASDDDFNYTMATFPIIHFDDERYVSVYRNIGKTIKYEYMIKGNILVIFTLNNNKYATKRQVMDEYGDKIFKITKDWFDSASYRRIKIEGNVLLFQRSPHSQMEATKISYYMQLNEIKEEDVENYKKKLEAE
jgi:hypothetical protein